MSISPIHHGRNAEAPRHCGPCVYWACSGFLYHFALRVFGVFWGVFGRFLNLSGTMYHFKTDAYHFRYGDYQGKKTGGWVCELHGSDPHQARRSASLSREPDLRPETGGAGLDAEAWGGTG